MFQHNILLSIGIPVYNGGIFMEDTINSIKMSKLNQDKIEIIVSDNCSTDNTEEIVKNFPFINYYKNEKNIGYDRNLQNIFEKANGNFVWTLAADDIILNDNVIDEIIFLIESNPDLKLIHVGGNKDLSNEYNIYNGECFLIDSKFQSGAVSSNIINRDSWLNSNPSSFFDSGWIHFGVIINIVYNSKTIITRQQLIDENPRSVKLSKSWNVNGSGLVIMLNLVKIFNNMKNLDYSREVKKAAKILIKKNYPKEIIKAKASGLNVNLYLIISFIKYYKFFLSFWFIDLIVLLLPKKLCKYIYEKRNQF